MYIVQFRKDVYFWALVIRKVMGVVPDCTLLVDKVAGEGETVIYFTLPHGMVIQVILYYLNLVFLEVHY